MRNKPLPGLCSKSPLKVDLTKTPNPTVASEARKKEYNQPEKQEKHPLGIEDPVELEKLYEKTEKPRQ